MIDRRECGRWWASERCPTSPLCEKDGMGRGGYAAHPVLVDAALELVGAPLVADVVRNEVSVTTPPARSVVTLVFVGAEVVGWFTTDVAAADVVLVADVGFELVFEALVVEVTEVEVLVGEDDVLADVVVVVVVVWTGAEVVVGGGLQSIALSNPLCRRTKDSHYRCSFSHNA